MFKSPELQKPEAFKTIPVVHKINSDVFIEHQEEHLASSMLSGRAGLTVVLCQNFNSRRISMTSLGCRSSRSTSGSRLEGCNLLMVSPSQLGRPNVTFASRSSSLKKRAPSPGELPMFDPSLGFQ